MQVDIVEVSPDKSDPSLREGLGNPFHKVRKASLILLIKVIGVYSASGRSEADNLITTLLCDLETAMTTDSAFPITNSAKLTIDIGNGTTRNHSSLGIAKRSR